MIKELLERANGLDCDSRILDVIQELCCTSNFALTIERTKSIDLFDYYLDCLTIQFNDLVGEVISIYSNDQNAIMKGEVQNNNTRKP